MTEKQNRESQAEIWVQRFNGEGWVDVHEANTMRDAGKWIAANGDNGETFRVARVWPAVRVEVEQTPRRVVKPA